MVMKERFLAGEDGRFFDYRSVDESDRYDDGEQVRVRVLTPPYHPCLALSLHPKQARDAEDRYFDDSDDSGPEVATTTRMDEDLDY